MKIHHIYLSAGHRYLGRWGKDAASHPTLDVPSVRCVAGRGLQGDRYFDHRDNFKGQVTLYSLEVHHDMCQALGLKNVSPAVVRRNVIVSGADLNGLIGNCFHLQGIELEGTEACAPCEWMNLAVGEGACDYLRGKGGLRCRILNDGELCRDE